MLRLGVWLIWLALYHYYLEQICDLEKGTAKRIVVWGISAGAIVSVRIALLAVPGIIASAGGWLTLACWLLIELVFLLYVLFYDGKPFRQQWLRALAPGFALVPGAFAETPVPIVLANGTVMVFFLLLLSWARGDFYEAVPGKKATQGHFRVWNGLADIAVYGIVSLYLWRIRDTADTRLLLGFLAVELLLFLSLEGTFFSYHRSFEAGTERFQRDILSHQYEEVKEIYLNMRGWRHDYHNHLQVMKAQISAGQLEEMKQYLNDLEQNLDKVDTYVKSGNLMTDAILNSKLSLAEQKGIRVNCKATLPQELSIEDVDLCVILGNLLDNALEACEKIPEIQRFLRIYMVVNRSQLYVSIQNSAKEELDFNERNYISTKRGNHGLGMKRVKALADKYEGYLTLANEPGIFAAEVTLPL